MIRNIANMKAYIGSSVWVDNRLCYHIGRLKRGIHDNVHLQSAYNKYGKDMFVCFMIEQCKKEDLLAKEDEYIKLYKTRDDRFGYNMQGAINSGQGSPWLGKKHSPESIEKMRIVQKKSDKYISEETRQKMVNSHLGHKASDETKKKMKLAQQARREKEQSWLHT